MSPLAILGSALIILALIVVYSVWIRIRHLKPSNDLSWVNENKNIAYAEINDDEVVLKNIRAFNWRTTTDYD